MKRLLVLLLLGISFGISTQQKCPGMPERERKKIEKNLLLFFEAGDTNRDGFLSPEKYISMLEQMDADGDGIMTIHEFNRAVQGIGSDISYTTVTAVYGYWDTDGATRIRDNIVYVDDFPDLIPSIDVNNDGMLSKKEFVSRWQKAANAGYILFINSCCPKRG